jgi:hypothetical protein
MIPSRYSRYPIVTAIGLLFFLVFGPPAVRIAVLVLLAISGALSLAGYIMYRRQEATPAAKAFRAWEAHCRTKRKSDLGRPDPVGDQLYAAYRAAVRPAKFTSRNQP